MTAIPPGFRTDSDRIPSDTCTGTRDGFRSQVSKQPAKQVSKQLESGGPFSHHHHRFHTADAAKGSATEPVAMFHGGIPGLQAGEFLDPPDVSGTTNTLSGLVGDAPHGTRRDVVYATRVQNEARAFAALYPNGALYRVEPIDVIGPDQDAPESAVMCRRARVVEVISDRIVFDHRPIDGWLRMLQGTR